MKPLTHRHMPALLCCAVMLGLSLPVNAGPPLPGLCAADSLFVSDNPEAVRATRGLFYAQTDNARCVRLLYHHENARSDSPMAIQVWARDDEDVPAHLAVTLGAGGPALDPMTVGHGAILRFWHAVLSGTAVPVEIAPHRWKPLVETVLQPHDVVSGLAQVQILAGRLTIVVLAYLPGETEADIAPSSFVTRVGTHPFGVFKSPFIEERLEARLDQPRGLLLAGAGYLRSPEHGFTLKGNYGVVYHLRVECVNPSSHPVLLTVKFSPFHGPAAATLIVNGTLVDIPPLGRDATREIGRYPVPPGRWPLDIWTTPEGASAYPVRLEFLPGG
ncbi:MAG TPA: hypothetical protein VGX75_15495 [bacterium]|nr:hypothetical protein [bacterium]